MTQHICLLTSYASCTGLHKRQVTFEKVITTCVSASVSLSLSLSLCVRAQLGVAVLLPMTAQTFHQIQEMWGEGMLDSSRITRRLTDFKD